jgi:hypothetical protein
MHKPMTNLGKKKPSLFTEKEHDSIGDHQQ